MYGDHNSTIIKENRQQPYNLQQKIAFIGLPSNPIIQKRKKRVNVETITLTVLLYW